MTGKVFILTIIVFIGIAFRLLPHEANFTPVLAIALISGLYFSRFTALILTIFMMLISDALIGFHSTMFFVYSSLILIVLIGSYFDKNKSFKSILGYSVISSIIFFVITNFGVFIATDLYPRSVEGLINCYYLAIPFFRNTLTSTVLYSLTIYSVINLAENFSLANLGSTKNK